MQIIRFTFALSSLVALLVHAAPTPTLVLDSSDSFEAREGDIDTDLWQRTLVPVGPGVKHREREDASADAYAQALAPRARQHHAKAHAKDIAKDRAKEYGHDQVQNVYHHAPDQYKDHPEYHFQDRWQHQDHVQDHSQDKYQTYHLQPHAQPHARAVRSNLNPEKAPKSGGFLKSKATKAKKAIQRIWRKLTGKH